MPATAYAAFDRHTFGDMTPWVFKTTDYGKTWTRIVAPDQGVRGYAHTIKEDTVKKELLFLGTELGLWISLDGGAQWAQFKGGDFPNVAVREVAGPTARRRPGDRDARPRHLDHRRHHAAARALATTLLQKSTAFLPSRPIQQRMPARGGWVRGRRDVRRRERARAAR